ncbi:MAG: esterase [Candidatus Wallbacteria bacterium]|nr:esterase [Candidatus Wallbacteria bacterium]
MKNSGQVVVETVESRVLQGNPWKDPHVRKLPVWLPPSYGTSPKRRYPVLWCLTGFTGSGVMLLNVHAFKENLPLQLDRLVATRKMPECIVAMPDCMTYLGGSQYINSAANGRYEDYLCDELVPFVDARYRTLAEPAHRGVFGKSSGGYGSVILAMRRPDVFGAFACHSGDMAFEQCYVPDFYKAVTPLAKAGGLKKFIKTFRQDRKPDASAHAALNTVAMAAAYSPSPKGRQPAIELPIDLETAELIPSVWSRWLDWDPVRLVEKHRNALLGLRLAWFDCGVKDEFNLHLGARILARRLEQHRIPFVHEEFDGGHFDIGFRHDVSLPVLSRAVG